MILYRSNSRQYEKAVRFPTAEQVDTLEDLRRVARFDHVAARLKDSYRLKENYLDADCVLLDLDNDHSDDPDEWKTLDDVADVFPGVSFYAIRSRNYMRPKKKGGVPKEPRPKYHIYLPSSAPVDSETYKRLVSVAYGMFPYFDTSALDCARMFYGVDDPQGEAYDGELSFDQFVAQLPDETITAALNVTEEATRKESAPTPEEITDAPEGLEWLATHDQKKNLRWLEEWAQDHAVKLGKRHIFRSPAHPDALVINVLCPWKHEHTVESGDTEAVIMIEKSGALSFKCQHASHVSKGWKDYRAEIERTHPTKQPDDPFLSCFKPLESFEEQEAEWLVEKRIPKGQITSIASDGGVGKTTLWCSLVAAISSGRKCFLDPEGYIREPLRVAFLTTEDSVRKKLKRKLREAGANMANIITPDFASDTSGQLRKLKFGSQALELFIRFYRPALCVFDPLQGFIPPDVNMGSRNAMRDCMAPLITLGEETGTTFLIICHTNKRKGAFGRDRIADSADLWDVSRSVLMMGFTSEKGVRYLSHEKSNYDELQKTILFTIDGAGLIHPQGDTWKRDREFMTEAAADASTPKREDCKDWILNTLEEAGGSIPSKDLETRAQSEGYSIRTLRRAKDELKQDAEIRYFQTGSTTEKIWFIARNTFTWSNDHPTV